MCRWCVCICIYLVHVVIYLGGSAFVRYLHAMSALAVVQAVYPHMVGVFCLVDVCMLSLRLLQHDRATCVCWGNTFSALQFWLPCMRLLENYSFWTQLQRREMVSICCTCACRICVGCRTNTLLAFAGVVLLRDVCIPCLRFCSAAALLDDRSALQFCLPCMRLLWDCSLRARMQRYWVG